MGSNSTFMRVDEVAKELSVSKSYAYKLIRKLNKELGAMGYMTVTGRINRNFFLKKVCYAEKHEKEGK